jgi:hypothetical protein
MFEPKPPTNIDIFKWLAKSHKNPILYRQRQLVEILLNAVAITPDLDSGLYLKGGILMALIYNSQRSTIDIDFSVLGEPEKMEEIILESLDKALKKAAAQTGHFEIECKVQRIVRRPRPDTFSTSPFPALEVTIGSASRNAPRELSKLEEKKASLVLRIDLSFREPIESFQKLIIGSGKQINAYGIYDLVSEKIRAILQQITRPHPGERRQDVYDLCCLFNQFDFDNDERSQILAILIKKSSEREFTPTINMISDEVIISKLRSSWPTLQQEIPEALPDFNKSFERVQSFYRSLPWDQTPPASG